MLFFVFGFNRASKLCRQSPPPISFPRNDLRRDAIVRLKRKEGLKGKLSYLSEGLGGVGDFFNNNANHKIGTTGHGPRTLIDRFDDCILRGRCSKKGSRGFDFGGFILRGAAHR